MTLSSSVSGSEEFALSRTGLRLSLLLRVLTMQLTTLLTALQHVALYLFRQVLTTRRLSCYRLTELTLGVRPTKPAQ
jgi:hypothetical protein